ncbi:hypothetical protein K501DRAFT_281638 [Backusella circina FSU 941]|nr:hypothetical protein K501DRAFT_281638 [Backusella circina FSU 941]
MEAEIKAAHTDISATATATSRHYFYRKATQPDLDNNNNTVFINVAESSDDFESRVTHFIHKDALQKTLVRSRQGAAADLTRRKADRKARKEREKSEDGKQQHRYKEEQQRTEGSLFEKLNTLNATEQGQWLTNIHDDAMLMNPHQWLKLASLFNVNSKASRQQTLISINRHSEVLRDRDIDDSSCVAMENYMELRDVQNRNYARDAVTEGVKYIKQNRIQEAMDYYKRALDMDPKYADGWFHVAEGLVQQRKLQDAAVQLEKALKLDPEHEGAKALLASIRYTTQTKKVEKGDEWDLVDENGNGLSSAKVDKKNEEEEKSSSKKKKKSSSSYRSSHRSSRRSSRSPDSRHRSRESRRDNNESKRRDRRSSPDSRRHRRSSRSKERRHDDHRSHRRDSSPSESRRHSRRYSRDRESRHKRRHRSRSPSRHRSKRKRSDDDDDDDDKSQRN